MTPHAPSRAGRGIVEDLGAMGAVGVALLLNVALVAMIVGIAMPAVRSPDTAAATLPAKELAALDPSCDGDAILRAAAQAAVCLTPLTSDIDACLDQTRVKYESEVLYCHVDQMEALPEIALVETPPVVLDKMEPIDAEPLLDPLTPDEMKKYEKAIQEVLAPPPEPPAPPPPPPPAMQQQVIEAPKPANEEAPDNARFLAEYDSKVDKQSAKHENKWEEMVAKPQPEELAKKDQPKPASKPEPTPDDADPGKQEDAPPVPGVMSMRKPGSPERNEVDQDKKIAGIPYGSEDPAGDGKQRKGSGSVDQDEKHRVETAHQGEGGAGGGQQRAPNLRPDDETLERLVGGGSVDRTEDVDEGDENAFNTKRFVYASFFNRMKRVVAQNWDPVSVWKAEDPEGKKYGTKTRKTILRVSLDAKGAVSKIIILSACGVDSLDDEAIRAFKAAQPFPNPPAALVDKDSGLITFEFGFYFDIEEKHTSWRYQRSS